MKSPTDKALDKLTRAALVQWSKIAGRLDCMDQAIVSRNAEQDAVRLVLLSAYLDALANGQTHSGAVNTAQKRVAKVRKALGYSYPKQGLASVSF